MSVIDFFAIGLSGNEPEKAEKHAFEFSPQYVIKDNSGYRFVEADVAFKNRGYRMRDVFYVHSVDELVSRIGDQEIRTLELLAHGSVDSNTADYREYWNAGSLSVGSGIIRFKTSAEAVSGKKYRRMSHQGLVDTWTDLASPVEANVDGKACFLDLVSSTNRSESCLPALAKLKFRSDAEVWISGCSIGRDPDFLIAFSLACGNTPVRAGIDTQLRESHKAGGYLYSGFEGKTITCIGDDCHWDKSSLGAEIYSFVLKHFQEVEAPPDVLSNRTGAARIPADGGHKRD